MAWIVCSECLSEFPLSHIEKYIQHKQETCKASTSGRSTEEPEFNCGYCFTRFNTSLALLLHVEKHDVKVDIVESERKMRNQKLFGRPIHQQEMTCGSEMDDSCCDDDDDDEQSFCGSHGKASDTGMVDMQLTDTREAQSELNLRSDVVVASALPQANEAHKVPYAVQPGANGEVRFALDEFSVDSVVSRSGEPHTIPHGNAAFSRVPELHVPHAKSADTVSNSGTAHSVAHSSVTSSHHRVKRHACAQTACTAFEQKSRCCCVDLNGQVMRLVSLGIIKLPDCCDPPPTTTGEHHRHTHHHCVAHGEQRIRTHSHERDRSESGTSASAKRTRNQEDGTQTSADAPSATDHTSVASLVDTIKIERNEPCACTTGCCERCAKRDRVDGECQTEFEWVDLDVDFDVDALLDANAPSTLTDLVAPVPAPAPQHRFEAPVTNVLLDPARMALEMPSSVGSQLDSSSQFDAHSQAGSSEPPLVLSRAGSLLNVASSVLNVAQYAPATSYSTQPYDADAVYSGGASLESLSLATGLVDIKRAGRYSEAYVAAQVGGTQNVLAANTQPLFISRDAGLLFGQPSAIGNVASQMATSGPSGLLASPHGKVFLCEQCGREFKQAIHLRKHNWSVHSNDGKPYKCPLTTTGECSYASVEKTHLQAHIRTHTGEKPYKCKYCDYAGKQSSTLRSHMLHKHPQEMLNERQQSAGLSPKQY